MIRRIVLGLTILAFACTGGAFAQGIKRTPLQKIDFPAGYTTVTAIARRVADLLGPVSGDADHAGAEMIFTSGRRHALTEALVPFFGGRVPA